MNKFLKKVASLGLLVVLGTQVVGCDRGLTVREKECLEATGDIRCNQPYRQQQVQTFHQEPVMVQSTNYYGHPQHGTWHNGQYVFNDPTSSFASQTSAFLLGAGLGSLATYAASSQGNRSSWKSRNKGGWKKRTRSTKRPVSRAEKQKRAAQSAKDKRLHKQKVLKKELQAKQAQRKSSAKSPSKYKAPVKHHVKPKYKALPKRKTVQSKTRYKAPTKRRSTQSRR